jgi:hypothetical protein
LQDISVAGPRDVVSACQRKQAPILQTLAPRPCGGPFSYLRRQFFRKIVSIIRNSVASSSKTTYSRTSGCGTLRGLGFVGAVAST